MRKLIIVFVLLALTFLLGEGFIRLLGKTDSDGNFYLFSRILPPYKYPAAVAKYQITRYLNIFSSHLAYDPDLGWAPRPLSASNNGLYFYNADGIRVASSDFPISKNPQEQTLRIAIFGDSFTHCSDVPFHQSWGQYLQEYFQKAGVNAEVLNFGVDGYGIDQAYLRWKKSGSVYDPRIVILGFAPEDVLRCVNILRPLFPPAWGEGIPFSKPRFIFDHGKLQLINVPALIPDKVPEVLKNIGSWDLSKHEYWLRFWGLQENFWFKSKFICLLYDTIRSIRSPDRGRQQFLELYGEPVQISLAIIDAFARDVVAHNAFFCIVYLPDMNALARLSQGAPPQEIKIIKELIKRYPVIMPSTEMLRKAREKGSTPSSFRHYNALENQLIASGIFDELHTYIQLLQDKRK